MYSIDEIKELLAAFDGSKATAVDIQLGADEYISIRQKNEKSIVTAAVPAAEAAPVIVQPAAAAAPAAAPSAPAESEGTAVESPMVGVFYAAPSPDSDPYVTVGSTVNKGDEAMNKEEIMNILPHRNSMLLIDEATKTGDNTCEGKKYITGQEWFLDGHFLGQRLTARHIPVDIVSNAIGEHPYELSAIEHLHQMVFFIGLHQGFPVDFPIAMPHRLNGILQLVCSGDDKEIVITNDLVLSRLQENMAFYDKSGEQHYDIISAFIKSVLRIWSRKKWLDLCHGWIGTVVVQALPLINALQ